MSPVYSFAFQTIGHLWSERQTDTLASRMHLLLVNEPILQRRAAERRATVRYKLRLPVIFHWNDGNEHTGGGFTNDVALDGALIFSSKWGRTFGLKFLFRRRI
jgi:hypothetical protein